MSKVLYEYHYSVGSSRVTCYKLIVEKETDKMFYGNVFLGDINTGHRFAVKKENINQLAQYVLKNTGTVYKVVVESDNHKQASYDIVNRRLQEVINNFKL
jgi:hypothetical protein